MAINLNAPFYLSPDAPRQLHQRRLATGLIEFLEAIKAVAGIAHDLAGLADIAQLLGQFQKADLGFDNLLCVRNLMVPRSLV
jgi:hypothetical protein